MYSFTTHDLEEFADEMKVRTLVGLVEEGILSKEEADLFSESHTIICRKKNFFRTISEKWKKEPESTIGHYWIMVKDTAFKK